ncbi:MAG: T9SS type A sorting domain-containing protein [Prolixibacteraceae bacterium]
MKRLLFYSVLTMFAFTQLNAQVIFDWEEVSPEIATWAWVPEIVENPLQEGLNTSDHVAGAAVSGGEWDGFVIALPGAVQFTYSHEFTMLVYAEVEGIVGMKLEKTEAAPEVIVWADYTTPLEWQKVTFTFAEDVPAGEHIQAAIFVNHGQGNESTLWYCDDLVGPDEEQATGIVNLNSVEVSIYPNPVKSILNINSTEEEINSIQLVNVTGSVLYSNYLLHNKSFELDMAAFKSGIYVMLVNGTKSMKVIKE